MTKSKNEKQNETLFNLPKEDRFHLELEEQEKKKKEVIVENVFKKLKKEGKNESF